MNGGIAQKEQLEHKGRLLKIIPHPKKYSTKTDDCERVGASQA